MKKWLKRILLVVALLLLATIVAALVGVHLVRGKPEWYVSKMTAAELYVAAERAEKKLEVASNWASDIVAHRTRQQYAARTGSTAPIEPAPGPQTISFSEAELNAFYDKWSQVDHADIGQKIGRYVTDPRIVMRNGRIIFAGTLIDTGTIASVQFVPAIDANGMLSLKIAEIDGGLLPIPRTFLQKPESQARQGILSNLPKWQDQANIASTGVANSDAIAASVGKLFVHVLDDQPADPVVFLPSAQGAVPVHVTAVKVDGENLSIIVEAMSDEERTKLLQKIREPFANTTAMNQ